MTVPRASFANGFAPRDGMPLYPSLWQGCVGAWAPCLGPTGLTLRDWSGYAGHGTLTNMDAGTDWVLTSGNYSLDFDGVNDFVNTRDNSLIYGLPNISVFAWVRQAALTQDKGIVAKWDYQTQGTFAFQSGQSIAGGLTLFLATSPTDAGNGCRIDTTGAVFSANQWAHVGFVKSGTSVVVYVNGNAASAGATLGSIPSTLTSATASVKIGAFGGTLQRSWNGQIDDVRIYNRVLNVNEIRLLASRRGIAYDLAPFAMPYSEQVAGGFQAAWALRQRLILGGGGGLG